MQNIFPKLSKTPGTIRSVAPQTVGQDNAVVYGALGIDAAEIKRLRAAGTI